MIWGWYTVKHDINRNIPIGSKLLMINGRTMMNTYNANNIDQLLNECTLPITLIFEAPKYLKNVPRSTLIQYQQKRGENTESDTKSEGYTNLIISRSMDIILWWLEDGGLVLILLGLLGIVVLNWNPLEFIKHRWYLILICIACIPDALWIIFHFFFLKHRKLRLFQRWRKRIKSSDKFSIVQEHRLNIHGHHRKHYLKHDQNGKQHHHHHQNQKRDSLDIYNEDKRKRGKHSKKSKEQKEEEEEIELGAVKAGDNASKAEAAMTEKILKMLVIYPI